MQHLRTASNVLWFFCLLGSSASVAETSTKHFGITLSAGSKLLEENRFASGLSYEDTKRDFSQRIAQMPNLVPIGEEINLPHVRAVSYRNTNPTAAYRAINIYLNVQTGVTEIFFVTRTRRTSE